MALLPWMSMETKGRAEPVPVRWMLCSLYRGCNQEAEIHQPKKKEQQKDRHTDLQPLYLEAFSATVEDP